MPDEKKGSVKKAISNAKKTAAKAGRAAGKTASKTAAKAKKTAAKAGKTASKAIKAAPESVKKKVESIREDPPVTHDDIMKLLDSCYGQCLDGIPKVSPSVEDMANDYLKKHKTKEAACKAMLKNQIAKCTTSGFLTGFGGVITLPVTLPANLASVIYVQMRMIACTAYMAGFDLDCDQTQTFVYACLAGVSVGKVVKQASLKFGTKLANSLIKRVPGKVLTRINQKVGFRFITKFGEKGIINLGKLVPGVGAVIGGALDFAETKIISSRAYKWFMEGDFEPEEPDEEIIDIEASDLEPDAPQIDVVPDKITE